MQNRDQMEVAMESIRNQLFEVVGQHEREAHDGGACMATRSSAIAFLAHCLSVNGESWGHAERFRKEYDQDCASNCTHTRPSSNGHTPPPESSP